MHDELTKVDIRKMQEEIDYRKSEVTPKLKEQLKAARDLGDLSENDEYHSVKRALNKNYGRIRYLQAMIDTAVVIDVDSAEDVVGLFDKITVYDEEEDEMFTPSELTYVKVITTTTANGVDKADIEDTSQPVTVTLLVNAEQAEVLAYYEMHGDMHIVLEYRGDSETAQKYLDAQNQVFGGN